MGVLSSCFASSFSRSLLLNVLRPRVCLYPENVLHILALFPPHLWASSVETHEIRRFHNERHGMLVVFI